MEVSDMTTTMFRSPRTLLTAATAVIALVLAGCGSSPASGSKSPASSPPAASSAGASGSGSSAGSSSGSIPQGATAGDADTDNHGGTSDGDGNL
jgi:ABC-type phosphate transport system substrate-binding protein